MDNSRFKIFLMAFVISIVIIVPVSYSVGADSQVTPAGGAAAGSVNDPIVTASYVAKYVSENQTPAGYELLELSQDQRVRAKSGTLELVIRPGSRARVSAGGQPNTGIANLTSGREYTSGELLPVNNQLLIPRADGRAVVVMSDIAYIFVRGDYEII
ncbi:MAG: hypothetical protein FWH24_02750 [Oscillospiraceae bacterium]|nr:hypothetical protein [Oscillospiraceae bacterium]